MPGKYEAPRKKGFPLWLPVLLVLSLALGALLFLPRGEEGPSLTVPQPPAPTEITTVPTTLPEPEHVVTTASIGAVGDLLAHTPIYHEKYNSVGCLGKDAYDFSPIYQYLAPYAEALDVAAANLETTLAGPELPYSGYPLFTTPDAIAEDARDAGFDLLLTANNHSYDTGLAGYKRTLETVRGMGLQTLGTMLTPEEPKFLVQDVNGIQIGMVCYTYASRVDEEGRPSLNGNPVISEAGICNYFDPYNLEPFYAEVEGHLREMEEAGAEASMIFLHWGVEYVLAPNDTQKVMAQKLCDLGFDVIIGGHPHVIQPMDLLESTLDPDHKTVCLYSLGNAVSNQRQGFSKSIATAHTEDGCLFSVTFEKYSDGTVYLAQAELLPLWVNKFFREDGKLEYNILPLDKDTEESWGSLYGIGADKVNACRASWDRTMALVGEGLAECQEYLARQKEAREQYYYDLVYGE